MAGWSLRSGFVRHRLGVRVVTMLDAALCLLGVCVVVACCWLSDLLLRVLVNEGERD